MNGKIMNYEGKSYGEIGASAFNYEGVSYFVGDVVEVYDEGESLGKTIVILSGGNYFPMWYSDMKYIEKRNYQILKVRGWKSLENKENFCDKYLYVEIENKKVIDDIIKLDLSESDVTNLVKNLGSVLASMRGSDRLDVEIDMVNMKAKASVISTGKKEFTFDFTSK